MAAAGNSAAALAIYRELSGPNNDPFLRIAAYRGLVLAEKEKAVPTVLALLKDDNADLQKAAGKFITEMPGRQTTQALAEQLSTLPATAQVVLLGALENRETRQPPLLLPALSRAGTGR